MYEAAFGKTAKCRQLFWRILQSNVFFLPVFFSLEAPILNNFRFELSAVENTKTTEHQPIRVSEVLILQQNVSKFWLIECPPGFCSRIFPAALPSRSTAFYKVQPKRKIPYHGFLVRECFVPQYGRASMILRVIVSQKK